MAEKRLPVWLERHADPASGAIVPTMKNERHHYVSRAKMLMIARACTNRQARLAVRVAFYSGMQLLKSCERASLAIRSLWRTPRTTSLRSSHSIQESRFAPDEFSLGLGLLCREHSCLPGLLSGWTISTPRPAPLGRVGASKWPDFWNSRASGTTHRPSSQ